MIEMNNGKEYFLSFRPHEIFIMDNFRDATGIQDVLMFKCAWQINPLKAYLSKDSSKWGWDGFGANDIKCFYEVDLKGSLFTKTKIEMYKTDIEIDLTKPIEIDSELFDDLIESTQPDSYIDYSGNSISHVHLNIGRNYRAKGVESLPKSNIIERLQYRDIATLTHEFKKYFFEDFYAGGSSYLNWEHRVSMLKSPIIRQLSLLPNQENITIIRIKQ